MAAFLLEALKGIKDEMATLDTPGERLRRLPRILSILGSEIAGLVSLVPYGVSTMHLYRSLPSLERAKRLGHRAAHWGVAIVRDIQYGVGDRSVLDLYLPAWAHGGHTPQPHPPHSSHNHTGQAQGQQEGPENEHREMQAGQQEARRASAATPTSNHSSSPPAQAGNPVTPLPVVFFVHGGIWASGEKWHYAPLATRLAQEGYIVVVPTYEYFPKVLAPQMVKSVSDALTWCQDNVASYGGDPSRIAVMAHSAGAHLAALVLLSRAAAAATQAAAAEVAAARSMEGRSTAYLAVEGRDANAAKTSDTVAASSASAPPDRQASFADSTAAQACVAPVVVDPSEWRERLGITDTRVPAMFVGLSGVYDVTKHYEFETARGVNHLSMMGRAMGGAAAFTPLSPSLILDHELRAHVHSAANNALASSSSGTDSCGATKGMHHNSLGDPRTSGRCGAAQQPFSNHGASSGQPGKADTAGASKVGASLAAPGALLASGSQGAAWGTGLPGQPLRACGLIGDVIPRRAGLSVGCSVDSTGSAALAVQADQGLREGGQAPAHQHHCGCRQPGSSSCSSTGRGVETDCSGSVGSGAGRQYVSGATCAVDSAAGQSCCSLSPKQLSHAPGCLCSADVRAAQRTGTENPCCSASTVTGGGERCCLQPSPSSSVQAKRMWQALPPMFVLSSCSDIMVPWHEGAAFVVALQKCGAPVRQLIYNHVSHQGFVMSWRPHMYGGQHAQARISGHGRQSPDFQRDLSVLLRSMGPSVHAGSFCSAGRLHHQASDLQGLAHVSRL